MAHSSHSSTQQTSSELTQTSLFSKRVWKKCLPARENQAAEQEKRTVFFFPHDFLHSFYSHWIKRSHSTSSQKRLICKYFPTFPPVNNWLLVAIFWVLSKALEEEPVRIEIMIVWQKSKPPKLKRKHMTLSIYIFNFFFFLDIMANQHI